MSERMYGKMKAAATPVFTQARNGLLQRKCACGGAPGLTGKCEECQRKELNGHRFTDQPESSAAHTIVQETLSSPGRPLDAATRAFMESRFGHDFSNVRVHNDARAVASARAINALAYTRGRDLVFGIGQYAPGTSAYHQLLAHELTHVIQQRGKSEYASLNIGEMGDSQEREADTVAQNIVSGPVERQIKLKAGSDASHIQRRVESHNKTGSDLLDDEMPIGEPLDGMELTQEEAELLEEALSGMGGESLAHGIEELTPIQDGRAAQKDDSDGKQAVPDKKKPAKRRHRIRKGNFVGGWLIRLLCGHSAKYFRHRDLLSCLKLKRKHKPEPGTKDKPEPEPKPEPKPEPEHKLEPELEHKLEPEPESKSKPEPEHKPEPEPKPEPKLLPTPLKSDDSKKPTSKPSLKLPPPTFGGHSIPPGASIVEKYEISFNPSSDNYENPSAMVAKLASLATFLKQHPGLKINVAGNIYNSDPGVIKGNSKAALSQGFRLNGKDSTADKLMLARASRVRETLSKTLKVTNIVNVTTGRILDNGDGLRIFITIINPAK